MISLNDFDFFLRKWKFQRTFQSNVDSASCAHLGNHWILNRWQTNVFKTPCLNGCTGLWQYVIWQHNIFFWSELLSIFVGILLGYVGEVLNYLYCYFWIPIMALQIFRFCKFLRLNTSCAILGRPSVVEMVIFILLQVFPSPKVLIISPSLNSNLYRPPVRLLDT